MWRIVDGRCGGPLVVVVEMLLCIVDVASR